MPHSNRGRLTPMRKTFFWTILVPIFWIGLVFVLSAVPVHSGLVTRPTKTCGQTTYVGEVGAGCTTIKSSEVDADLAAIITGGVNNIETANVNAAGLGTNALATSAVTTAKIADANVTTPKIADLNVTTGKLAVGASLNNSSAVATTATSLTTVETTIVTLGSITTRGGRIVLNGSWNLRLLCLTPDDGVGVLTLRIKRDGSTISTITHSFAVEAATGDGTIVPVPNMAFTEVPTAAAHVYTITGQGSSLNGTCLFNLSAAGLYYVLELA